MANAYITTNRDSKYINKWDAPMPTDEKSSRLKDYIATHNHELQRIIRHYVMKFGLANGNAVETMAQDVFSTVVTEALKHVDRLHTVDNPLPWLLGIAVNIIRRQRDQQSKLERREPLIHDLYPKSTLNEHELIDQFIGIASEVDDQRLENHETLSAIFEHLSDDEANLLQLAILYDLDSTQIASRLGISAGAVRVRLHRTLKKIRQYWGVK